MKLIIAFLMVFPQLVMAQGYNDIFGRWTAENSIWNQGIQYQLGFLFSPNQATLTVDCFFNDGVHLQTSTNSFAGYSGNAIYIQENRRNTSQDPYHYCQSTLAPSVWTVYFDVYGRMLLTMPTPYQMQFSLVRSYNGLN